RRDHHDRRSGCSYLDGYDAALRPPRLPARRRYASWRRQRSDHRSQRVSSDRIELRFGHLADAHADAMNESAIKLRGLVKRYGERTVVNGVTAEVKTGAVVGLLGPHGAGKTTTFYMVVGLGKPDGGAGGLVEPSGEIDLTAAPMYARARNGIGYLAQENSIF